MKVRLDLWLQRNFDPPPHIRTARQWIKEGKLYPPAVKVGRSYYVDENAKYFDYAYPPPQIRSDTRLPLVERLRLEEEARAKIPLVEQPLTKKKL